WKRGHITAKRTIAVPSNQQADGLRPDIHLWLDKAHHWLRGRHRGQRCRDEGLMAHRDGTDVETQVLTELPGPGSSSHDYPLGSDGPCRSPDRPDRAVSEFNASDGCACTDGDSTITGRRSICRRHRAWLYIAITRHEQDAFGLWYLQGR